MGHQETILELIRRDRGKSDADLFQQFRLSDTQPITDTVSEMLGHLPVMFGACAQTSAAWAALLRDRHNIPAVTVVGDLIIEGTSVFPCDRNIPDPANSSESDWAAWNGHCWIEIDGYVGDMSIFRTAKKIERPSVLKAFIERHFGPKRGAILVNHSELAAMGMYYVPKYVLTEDQINALINVMRHQVRRIMGTP